MDAKHTNLFVSYGIWIKEGYDTLLFALQARMAVGQITGWNLTKVETGSKRELAHTMLRSSSTLDSHLFPLSYASLLTRSTPHWCMCGTPTHASFSLSTDHRHVNARACTSTHWRTRPTAQGTSAHHRSSNRITLSLSRRTSLYASLSIANRSFSPFLRHTRSLACSLVLALSLSPFLPLGFSLLTCR